MSTTSPEEPQPKWSRLKRALVWASFAWLAVLAGAFGWAWLRRSVIDEQAPQLVEVVDLTVRNATRKDPGLLDRLITTGRLHWLDGSDVLSEVPRVRCAKPFRFSVTSDGVAVIGYRGTCLAEDVCVRTQIWPSGHVSTSRHDCTLS